MHRILFRKITQKYLENTREDLFSPEALFPEIVRGFCRKYIAETVFRLDKCHYLRPHRFFEKFVFKLLLVKFSANHKFPEAYALYLNVCYTA